MRAIISAGLAAMLAVTPLAPGMAAAQDTNVDGLIVTSREQPAPRIGLGAPMYSPEQTASFVCVAQQSANSPGGGGQGLARAERAHEATVKARQVRMNPASTRAEMNEAERARQEAVREMTGSDGFVLGGLLSLAALLGRGDTDPTTERDGVEVDSVKTSRVLENGRAVLNITGRAHNTGKERVELLPLSITAKDAAGFTLAAQSNLLGKAALEPGESLNFTVRFRNPPQYTATVDVRFSRGFETRNFRGCDFFDPLIFNPRQIEVAKARAEATPIPPPKVGPGAPAYTAKELAILFPLLLSESQTAFNAGRNEVRCPNAPPPNRHAWRALFAQSDLAYEAWVATNAAEEIRRDASMGPVPTGELEAAELQRQAAVNAFVRSRPPPLKALSPEGTPVKLEAIEQVRAEDGAVTIKGQMRNTGLMAAQPHGLLVTVRDPHGLVVRESLRTPAAPLAPGAVLKFSFGVGVRGAVVDKVDLAFRADPPPPPPPPKREKNKDPCALAS